MGLLSKLGLMTKTEHNKIIQDAVDKFNKFHAQQVSMRTMQVDETIAQIMRVSIDRSEVDRDGALVVRMEFPRSFAFGIAQGDEQVAGFAVQRIAVCVGKAMGAVVNPPQDPSSDRFIGGF